MSGNTGMTVRRAAVVAGLAYLLNPVSYAEFSIYPQLVNAGDMALTEHNISVHSARFGIAILCYLTSFLGDVVLAWALYVLLAPVNKALSQLTAWFQLVYAAIAISAVINLASVYHLVNSPDYLKAFGEGPLQAQVLLLLHSFRYAWSIALLPFGIHLILLGWLIIRSGYIPWILGSLLIIDGLGWMIDTLQPYLLPGVDVGFTSYTALGELIFMLWLLIRAWKIESDATIRSRLDTRLHQL